MQITKLFKAVLNNNSGATAIEYGLIVALIAIAVATSIGTVADKNTGLWASVAQDVTEASSR